MIHHIPFRALPWGAALFAAFLIPVSAKSSGDRGKNNEPRLRLICASILEENQQVVLASHDAKGKWRELATVDLRSSLITDWLPAEAGELHLALREDGALTSICRFDYPAGSRRVIAALVADQENKTYEAHVVDPVSKGFEKGSMLIFNFSPHTGTVLLGSGEETVEAGQELVAKPVLEGGLMYRMMVSYLDADDKAVSCYDRQISGNPNARSLLFLLPDKTLGVRVLSLPMFGSFD